MCVGEHEQGGSVGRELDRHVLGCIDDEPRRPHRRRRSASERRRVDLIGRADDHGFAVSAPLEACVDTPFGAVEVSHVCLNDNVVEGLRCRDVPAFTVQYHPEAAAGPHDADYLFDRFVELIGARTNA